MRCAVFVDAGYLFAGGTEVLTGTTRTRRDTDLDIEEVIKHLKETAEATAGNAQLLRILWYDGMMGGRRTPHQDALARADDVKLRLGTVTSFGQQKGVDSLIVTDLIDLARNQAISDAVIVSGDADIRVGIEVAQKFGARIHLVGISPAGMYNQSLALREEADTVKHWTKEDIQKFLSIKPGVATGAVAGVEVSTHSTGAGDKGGAGISLDVFNQVARDILDAVSTDELAALCEDLKSNPRFVPSSYDGRLLAECRNILARDLEYSEKTRLRDLFRQRVGERTNQ